MKVGGGLLVIFTCSILLLSMVSAIWWNPYSWFEDQDIRIRLSPDTQTLSLPAGNSYVALPVSFSVTNASDMSTLFPTAPGGLRVYVYRNGGYTILTKRAGVGFSGSGGFSPPLGAGDGLLIQTTNATTLDIAGQLLQAIPSVNIVPGSNLIALPYCTNGFSYHASQLLQELSNQGKSCLTMTAPTDVNPTAQWFSNNATYNTTGTRTDFTLDKTRAYWLTDCSSSATWIPSCTAPVAPVVVPNASFLITNTQTQSMNLYALYNATSLLPNILGSCGTFRRTISGIGLTDITCAGFAPGTYSAIVGAVGYAPKVVSLTLVQNQQSASAVSLTSSPTDFSSATCFDSDGGLNYTLFGTLFSGSISVDRCNDDKTLVETSCASLMGPVAERLVTCPQVCSGGACVGSAVCTDSDGGVNAVIAGTASIPNGGGKSDGQLQRFSDTH